MIIKINKDGNKLCYKNNLLHNYYGPAAFSCACKIYTNEGEQHNELGPAYINFEINLRMHFLNGKFITKKDWEKYHDNSNMG